MLIISYALAVGVIASVAALSACLGMVGGMILDRAQKRRDAACKPGKREVSCDTCVHNGPWSDMMRNSACAACLTRGFGQGYKRGHRWTKS